MTKKILIIAVTAVILVAVLAVFAVLAPGSRNNDNEPSDSTTPAPSADGDNTAGSSGTQFYVIDGFIVSPNVSVQSVAVQNLQFHASDHNPVLLEAELRP